MFLGKRFENERADGVFAISGAEKGQPSLLAALRANVMYPVCPVIKV
jgi:hypothetical protein